MSPPPGPRCQRCGQHHALYRDCVLTVAEEQRRADQEALEAEARYDAARRAKGSS